MANRDGRTTSCQHLGSGTAAEVREPATLRRAIAAEVRKIAERGA